MASYKHIALTFLLCAFQASYDVQAFTTSPSSSFHKSTSSNTNKIVRDSKTRLYIIGPMIRKMREEEAAKKNIVLFSDEEKELEAPGLKVGTGVWKWPPVWPYAPDFFLRPREEEFENQKANNPLSSAMLGMGGANTLAPPSPEEAAELSKKEAEAKVDATQFWSVEKKGVLTDLDPEAESQLKNHYSYYLRDGMSVLELGAAEKSYLPDGLKLSRLVGVGLNKELMDTNKDLTEMIVTDLNDVVPERGVNSEELNKLGRETFDVVLIANTIEFLTNPREVFKSAWTLLKPGGLMMVSFSERQAMKPNFGDAQTKMWRGYNDDQHMWMAGSFFQFSAGDGWEGLKGFDVSPESAKKTDETGFFKKLTDKGKNNNMFVCQAKKAMVAEAIDDSNPEKSFSSLMWMTPTMESRDKMLVAPRLARVHKHYKDEPEKQQSLQKNVDYLQAVYESLIKMDQFAFPFALQATLAADLITDPLFNANEKQMEALKMGLGLKKPSKEFWAPVGQLTMSMGPDEKVNLLAHIVPRFGSDDPKQEEALETFITGLKPTIAVVKSKCVDMSDADATLVATELAASELLTPGRSTKEEYATWLAELTDKELMEYATQRKSLKENADAELQAMKDEREAEKERQKELEEKFKKQVDQARKERTMRFNEKTGKMEVIE